MTGISIQSVYYEKRWGKYRIVSNNNGGFLQLLTCSHAAFID
jgi:hypothetical protein